MAEEGLEQVLTLWLLQCVTVAWFSGREGKRTLSALPHSPSAVARREGQQSWCLSLGRDPLTLCSTRGACTPLPVCPQPVHRCACWVTPASCVLLSRATGRPTHSACCCQAVPAGCLLGTGALTALLVADVLVYLVDSPVPVHTAEGNNRGRSAFMTRGGSLGGFSPLSFQAVVQTGLSLLCLRADPAQPGPCASIARRLGEDVGRRVEAPMPWHCSRAAPALCLQLERQLGARLAGSGQGRGGSGTPNPTSLPPRWVTPLRGCHFSNTLP